MVVAIPSGEVCVLLGELSHLHVNPSQGRRQNYLLSGRPQAPWVRETQRRSERKTKREAAELSALGRVQLCSSVSVLITLSLVLTMYLNKITGEHYRYNSSRAQTIKNKYQNKESDIYFSSIETYKAVPTP